MVIGVLPGHKGRIGHHDHTHFIGQIPALDSGELACRHARSFARHRTITALEHARALKAQRDERRRREPVVEVRPLERCDALIA